MEATLCNSDIPMAIILLFILVFIICFSNITLREKYDEEIRIVWYLFSFTVVLSFIIGLWATQNQAIDSSGSFRGEAGQVLLWVINASVDINTSFKILAATVVIIVVPQLLTYVFSGLFGVATKPVFLSESISFLVWGIVKTLIVTSGVTISILLFGFIMKWDSFTGSKSMGWTLLSIGFNSFAFLTLAFFRETKEIIKLFNKLPNCLLITASSVHKCFTRHKNKDKPY